MQKRQAIQAIRDVLSAATGTIVTEAQAGKAYNTPDVQRLLCDPAVAEALTDSKLRRALIPTNAGLPPETVLVQLLTQWQHGGGKNAPHKNPKAKKSAEEEYKQAKADYENLKKKSNKTKDDKKELKRLQKQKEHWRKKADETGENHSQRAKGQTSTQRSATDGEEASMEVFSFVMEANGGTYLSQVEAVSVDAALEVWAESVKLDPAAFPSGPSRAAMLEEVRLEEATPVEGLKGVWCFCLPVGDDFVVVHVIGR